MCTANYRALRANKMSLINAKTLQRRQTLQSLLLVNAFSFSRESVFRSISVNELKTGRLNFNVIKRICSRKNF